LPLLLLYISNRRVKKGYVSVIAIVVFMFGMLQFSAKKPRKNQDKEEDYV